MQLTLENPDFRYLLRGVNDQGVQVNEQRIGASFIVSPLILVQGWRPRQIADLHEDDMAAILELGPTVVLLGTGSRLTFPSPAVMASCLTRGIGIEVMDNAAAARTFNVLATEARRVVAAFLL